MAFLAAGLLTSLIFAWEIGAFRAWLATPVRPAASMAEWEFVATMTLLIALNAGLYAYGKAQGSCPIGVKRATGIAGLMGLATLLCPACTVIPLVILGSTISLTFLAPFLPLLRLITMILLVATCVLLWPRKTKPAKMKR